MVNYFDGGSYEMTFSDLLFLIAFYLILPLTLVVLIIVGTVTGRKKLVVGSLISCGLIILACTGLMYFSS